MKKILVAPFLLLVSSLLLNGCSSSDAPECDCSEVTNSVKEKLIANSRDNVVKKQTRSFSMTYEKLKQYMKDGEFNDKQEKFAEKVIEETDARVEKQSFDLYDIKTISTHKKYKKSECIAKVDDRNLEYVAQRNEDGNIEVEVFR